MRLTEAEQEYMMSHRPNPEGPPAYDLLQGNLVPNDVYDHPEWYGNASDRYFRQTVSVLFKIRGKPNAKVKVYRSSPSPILNSGDWVSLSKHYATTSGFNSDDPSEDDPLQTFVVAAKDVRWDMNDLSEFGYFGARIGGTPEPATEGFVRWLQKRDAKMVG